MIHHSRLKNNNSKQIDQENAEVYTSKRSLDFIQTLLW